MRSTRIEFFDCIKAMASIVTTQIERGSDICLDQTRSFFHIIPITQIRSLVDTVPKPHRAVRNDAVDNSFSQDDVGLNSSAGKSIDPTVVPFDRIGTGADDKVEI